MMPPGGAEARAERVATLSLAIHARESDPGLGALLDALEPWAAGRGSRLRRRAARLLVAARLREVGPRAGRAGRRDVEGPRARPARVAGGARGQRLRPLPRLAAAPRRAAPALRRVLRGLRAPLRRPARRLRARPHDGRAAAAVRRAARRARAARHRRRRRGSGAQRRRPARHVRRRRAADRGDDVLEEIGFDPQYWRLDPTLHPFAAGLAPSDIRLTTKYDESDFAVALYSALHEFGHGLYEAQVDQQPVPHDARRPGVARRARVAEPHVGEPRRPLAPVLRVAAPAARRVAAGHGRRARRGRPVPRGQHRPAVADPHRGRRDDLQPAHRPALRARAGADRGHAVRRRPAGRLGRGDGAPARRPGPDRRRRRAAGRALEHRAVRLLPDLHAREPDRLAAVGAHRARTCRTSTSRSCAASSRRCASGCASTSTATAASSRRASCCAGSPATTCASSPSSAICARSSPTPGRWRARPDTNVRSPP